MSNKLKSNFIVATGSKIQIASGEYWDFENPQISSSNIDIETIAHSLSNICRFTGHVRKFYSVAQHSVLCSLVNPSDNGFAKLMHDIADSKIGDVSSPLKRMLPDYQRIETNNEVVMLRRFDLPTIWISDSTNAIEIPNLPPCVKQVDKILLVTEKRDLMPSHKLDAEEWAWAKGCKPLPFKIRPWCHRKAKHAFLMRFYELCPPHFLVMPRWRHVIKHRIFMAICW